jgi:hypothetical protein
LLKSHVPTTRQGAITDLIQSCPNAQVLTSCLKDALASTDGTVRCTAALFAVAQRPGLASEALDQLVTEIVHPVEGTLFYQ